MESNGIPREIIHMVQMLYEGSECAVLDEGEESGRFKVKTGVKQGDVWIYLIDGSGLDNEKTTAGNKTWIRWNFTYCLFQLLKTNPTN